MYVLISLSMMLFAFWLALSGHYTVFLMAMGALSVAVCVVVAKRMRILDLEGHPSHFLKAWPSFFIWLAIEIVKSALSVARIILDPRLPISPTMTRVRAGQKTSVGIATYGNSITLTPGTITAGVKGTVLTVHALQTSAARELEKGGMDSRVVKLEEGRL